MVQLEQKLERLEKLIVCTQKTVLNIDDVCTLTGLSKSTLYKFTMLGTIPHYKQAKHLYFDRLELESWMKANRGFNAEEIKADAASCLNINKGGQKYV
nr:helix-turn-helix domain-containing protein [uncultured Marinifilum sp.]